VLLYLDGRQIQVAHPVACALSDKDIPILFDIEKQTSYTEDITKMYLEILKRAKIIVISREYALSVASKLDLLEALVTIFLKTKSTLVITTCGSLGSILIQKVQYVRSTTPLGNWLDVEQFLAKKKPIQPESFRDNCISYFLYTGNINEVCGGTALGSVEPDQLPTGYQIEILHCSSYPLLPGNTIDTTGAGDTYVGALGSSHVMGLSVEDSLTLSSFLAAKKCTQTGGHLHHI